jgi:hypothetical protein
LMSSGTTAEPMNPVAPVRKTFIFAPFREGFGIRN